MFGTSGIRGIYGKEITETLAYGVAQAFARETIVIGRDIRASGLPLLRAIAAGARDAGKRVLNLGIAPTPAVALATREYAVRGIMITASHNPEEYNGLKLFEDGREITRAQEREVERSMDRIPSTTPKPEKAPPEDPQILGVHRQLIKNLVDGTSIAKKKPKVVVDCNGAAAVSTPYLLVDLGCRVLGVNAGLSGFNRLPEPTAKNLGKTLAIVHATNADFGVAHDGDADRAVIIDENGNMLGLDVQLALALEQELEHAQNRRVLTTVEASLLVRETIERLDGTYEILPVGSTGLSHRLEASGAIFAGEPCGEYIYSKGVPCPDGILVAAKFAQLFAEKGSLAALAKRFKPYPMLREKYPCKKKEEAMEKIKNEITIDGKRSEEDGLRIDEEDGWFLIRPSGTEPVMRLTIEYKDKKKLEERANALRKLIQHCV